MVDIYFEICHMPRVFEWNYMHSWVLQYCCVDIDGVLCEDPSFFENDDGKRYRKFLLHAQPKLVPTKKIGYIVTARLENVLITPQGVGKHLKILANDWRFTSKRVVKKLLKKI